MKYKQILIVTLIICSVFISFYFLKNIQHKPIEAISISNNFLNLILTGRLEEAYSLTNKNAIIGTSLAIFKNKVDKEWIRHAGNVNCEYKLGYIFPKQSYGNRLHRYLKGNKVDLDRIYMNYNVCAHPLGITLNSNNNGDWKVINFQTHAE